MSTQRLLATLFVRNVARKLPPDAAAAAINTNVQPIQNSDWWLCPFVRDRQQRLGYVANKSDMPTHRPRLTLYALYTTRKLPPTAAAATATNTNV